MGDDSDGPISARARELLDGPESLTVEFKESISGLSADDLVAFANTESGGTILIGVREVSLENGLQRGEVIGEPVGDKPKLSILNRAASCTPPINCEVVFEDVQGTPFIRIEIPSGTNKPYCTSGGTYKIRDDARNLAMSPGRMLALFMEKESSRFLDRFSRATDQLHSDLDQLSASVEKRLAEVDSLTEINARLKVIEEELKKGE